MPGTVTRISPSTLTTPQRHWYSYHPNSHLRNPKLRKGQELTQGRTVRGFETRSYSGPGPLHHCMGLSSDQAWKDILPRTHVKRLWVWTRRPSQALASLPCQTPHPTTQFVLSSPHDPQLLSVRPDSEIFIFVSTVDVKSWLVMFGFQLSNIIPGFPRAKMYFVPPPYELSESQASENGQVSGGSCQESERLSSFPVANGPTREPRACQ